MEAHTERLCQVKTGKGGRLSFTLAPAAGIQLAEALDRSVASNSLLDPYQQLPGLITRLDSPSTTGARGVDLSEGDILLIIKHKPSLSNLGRAAQGALHSAEAALGEKSSKKGFLVRANSPSFSGPSSGSRTGGAS